MEERQRGSMISRCILRRRGRWMRGEWRFRDEVLVSLFCCNCS
jgi:hypothetical protein